MDTRHKTGDVVHLYSTPKQERTFKALTLMLGPATADALRSRAETYLARQGATLLPLLITTLNHYPEITSPSWPAWPPQYEHCSRLLLRLCQEALLPLENVLEHPAVTLPIGPVLWTTVIEAADLYPQAAYEPLLRAALMAPWQTTRYAAAMALADIAGIQPLHETTRAALRTCQQIGETTPIRLTASYALLRCHDSSGIETLMKLLVNAMPAEVRKAAVFVLATEPPTHLNPQQQQRLHSLLITALVAKEDELSRYAARALVGIAQPATLSSLTQLLASPTSAEQALIAIEELAERKDLREAMQQYLLPASILPLLHATSTRLRRQASYSMAAIGGPYASAVLGATLLNNLHTRSGHVEAIEAVRLLHDVLLLPTRTRVVQWLLYTLRHEHEEVQVTALDSLAYLVWQASTLRQKSAYSAISTALIEDSVPMQLLTSPHAWVRQRAIELLCMLHDSPPTLHRMLIQLLQTDTDSGVRACIAYILGETTARWAIPTLLHTLLDTDEQVAITALHALRQLASAADAIVVYCLQELTYRSAATTEDELAEAARLLLKQWRNAKR